MSIEILKGHSVDLISKFNGRPDLIVTDPPYAFGGSGDEHALSASVAVVLREAAKVLKRGGWMLTMSASSWRSTLYMVEAVRGIVTPVRTGTWCKPKARTKTSTAGWSWASVNVIAFRKGKSDIGKAKDQFVDHITATPVTIGRRAELPPEVADWMVYPYSTKGGLLLDPFCGSGAILRAGDRAGMRAIGFEINPTAREEE